MRAKLTRTENGCAIPLHHTICDALGLQAGEEVQLEVHEGVLTVRRTEAYTYNAIGEAFHRVIDHAENLGSPDVVWESDPFRYASSEMD
jgi:antitoxin component of MazEF toxin-antitoxin module